MPYTTKILFFDDDDSPVQVIMEIAISEPAIPDVFEKESAFSGGEAKAHGWRQHFGLVLLP